MSAENQENSLWPTFMTIFIDLVLQTPPSWLSMPSMVPLDVAAGGKHEVRPRRWTCTCSSTLCTHSSVSCTCSSSRTWLIPLIKSPSARSSPRPLLSGGTFRSLKPISLSNCDCNVSNGADGPREGGGLAAAVRPCRLHAQLYWTLVLTTPRRAGELIKKTPYWIKPTVNCWDELRAQLTPDNETKNLLQRRKHTKTLTPVIWKPPSTGLMDHGLISGGDSQLLPPWCLLTHTFTM